MKESFLSFSSILLINPLKYSILSIILSKRFSFWRFIYPVIKNSLEYSIMNMNFPLIHQYIQQVINCTSFLLCQF